MKSLSSTSCPRSVIQAGSMGISNWHLALQVSQVVQAKKVETSA